MRFEFEGGEDGEWRIERIATIAGAGLAPAERLTVRPARNGGDPRAAFLLQGTISNIRYATAFEAGLLRARQEGLGRPHATRAALIPIRKSSAWWAMAQDERRHIFEECSHHTAIGLEYLPAVARRLFHSRDLGEQFDFLTWFEYAPGDEAAFEALVARLRASEEWRYVEREVDIRLGR